MLLQKSVKGGKESKQGVELKRWEKKKEAKKEARRS